MKTLLLSLACLGTLSITEAKTPFPKVEPSHHQIILADTSSYGSYAGKYIVEGLPFESLNVMAVNGKLLVSAGGNEGELTPLAGEDQFDAAGQATLTFIRDASKAVTGIKLNAQGQDFFGKKDAPKLDIYGGKYKFEGLPFEYVVIKIEDGKLLYTAGDYQGQLTQMAGQDKFDASGQASVKFNRGTDNRITSMILSAQGQDFTGPKEAGMMALNSYVGEYAMQGLPFETIGIKATNGKLMIKAGDEEGELTPMGEPDLYDAGGRATIKFVRDASKKVTGVSVGAQGMEFSGTKK